MDLPLKVMLEFSSLCSGLLSNAALAALGEIRTITHRVIGKFSRKLDEAYLNHRALTNPSEEAESHVIPLIADEIQDALEGRGMHRFLSESAIEMWLSDKGLVPSELASRMGSGVAEDSAFDRMLLVVKKGLQASVEAEEGHGGDKWTSNIKKLNENKGDPSYITKCLTKNDVDAENSDRAFSVLTSIRSRYETPPPQLRMGTLISEGEGEDMAYFLCVQPLCDCVRIPSAGRDFVFLRVGKKSSPDVLVGNVDDGFHELKVDYSPHNSVHLRFSPKKSTGDVIAKEKNGKWLFSGDDGKRDFSWIADLKPAHAQRIANKYATQVSRVGLTESEWIRRQ